MNNNYHYIIAGLPDIAPDMNGSAPTYESLVAVIKEQLSERDLRLVDWLGLHQCTHTFMALTKKRIIYLIWRHIYTAYTDIQQVQQSPEIQFQE